VRQAKKILLTGCNGFIGTNFLNLIYKSYPDLEIFNIDSLDFEISKKNHIDKDSNRYHFIHGSILDKELLSKLFAVNKFDQIINFAANSHVDNSITNPEAFTYNNVIGTQRLLDMALKYEPELFLQISTDEVYGSLEFDSPSTTESASIQPNNPYSASKAGADCLVRSYYRTFKLPCIITRSSNNFGPYQYPEKFIPVVISNAFNNQSIPVYGTGNNVRDWIYVEDNCRAVDLVRNQGQIGEIYNIPGHEEVANIDLARTILKVLGKNESLIKFVEDRKGHDLRYSMNGSKLKSLGFKLEESFEDGLAKTIEWYKTNTNWLKVKSAVV
jgi:dTDP-glucose 4,6-dehydratase